MKSFSRVGVFIAARPIELIKPMIIGRKVSRHPVDQHSDAAAMKVVDEMHEVMRLAKTA